MTALIGLASIQHADLIILLMDLCLQYLACNCSYSDYYEINLFLILYIYFLFFLFCKYKEKQRGRATDNLDTWFPSKSIQVLTNTKQYPLTLRKKGSIYEEFRCKSL